MTTKKIIVPIKKDMFYNFVVWFSYYSDAFMSLYKNHNINTVFVFELKDWQFEPWFDYPDHISYLAYQDYEDLLQKLQGESIQWVYTFSEPYVLFANKLAKDLWIESSKDGSIFVDKNKQRESIKGYPSYAVQSLMVDWSTFNLKEQLKNFDFPVIVKPAWWVQSSWVIKVESIDELESAINESRLALTKLEQKSLSKKEILVEEFIKWQMFSVDYFVKKDQSFIHSSPVRVLLWTDIWVQDFFNFTRIITPSYINQINPELLQDFISTTILAGGLKNTFVHHEFFLTTEWKLKTIEINWRIGWYRLEMIQLAYEQNLIEFPFVESFSNVLKNHVYATSMYPSKDCVLRWFNHKLLKEISWLKSFYRSLTVNKFLWKEVGLTKSWFDKLWSIILKHPDESVIKNDFEFVTSVYNDLLVLD